MNKQKGWKKILLRTVMVVFGLFALGVIVRIPFVLDKQKTDEAVAKIHATKLMLADAMGTNLPPEPNPSLKDATVEGIDANRNGIRDDVELAIFKEYPNSAKTRAVLLQYALALQMEVVQPIINGGTVGAVADQQDRAFFCMAKIAPYGGEDGVIFAIEKYGQFIADRQFNLEERKKAHKDFYSHLESGRIDDSISCDIELSSLPN